MKKKIFGIVVLVIVLAMGLFAVLNRINLSDCSDYIKKACSDSKKTTRCENAKTDVKGWNNDATNWKDALVGLETEMEFEKDNIKNDKDFPPIDEDAPDLKLPGEK